MKSPFLKSAWAVLAGLLVNVILSVAFDTILKFAGILPWDHLFVSTGLILFVIFYRAVFSLAGCYLTAKLAPRNPMKHAIILGIIGTVLSAVGAVLGADLGPVWYAWTLAVIAIPIAWLGGKLYERKHAAASGSEYIIKQ
jgi:MFS-type transporter involved in bile tolerance (Atg22 family)